MAAIERIAQARSAVLSARHTVAGAPRRLEGEAFIADIFRRHYGARVTSFAPNLMLLERAGEIAAAVGWRGAGSDKLFLESYLDQPIEDAVSRLAGHPVKRERIVEVGNLAAEIAGGSAEIIVHLATHLDRLGYEWVAFTATSKLIGIFQRLGLPPLALAPADPQRLGAQATDWGSYYASNPVVVAGRVRLALDRVTNHV